MLTLDDGRMLLLVSSFVRVHPEGVRSLQKVVTSPVDGGKVNEGKRDPELWQLRPGMVLMVDRWHLRWFLMMYEDC